MSGPSTKAETVIKNANVFTIDPRNPKAQSLAFRDGKILAVGSNEDVSALVSPDTKVLDLMGKTVLPGFIDAHIHVLSSGIRHVMSADCALPSIPAILDALRERARLTPAGQWVQGFKFDDTKTEENRFITRWDLDAVSNDHPILLAHRAGHIYYVNSRGLEEAGYHKGTNDPPGGHIGREEGTGELNGALYERAADPRSRCLLFDPDRPVKAGGPPGGVTSHLSDVEQSGTDQRPRCEGNQRRSGHLPGGQKQRRP